MKLTLRTGTVAASVLFMQLAGTPFSAIAQSSDAAFGNTTGIKRVLLISIDGMHALDFANCAKGVSSINGGTSYCPNLAELSASGVNYVTASTTKPSDSFPGSGGLATGGSARTTGMFYDVNYNRALSPPAKTTPYKIVGGANLCPSVVGTQVGFDEQIDVDLTKLDGGGGINPDYLPRDPNRGCRPVYPHNYIRVNTMFEVVRNSGGYTAWSDKHPAYDFYNGPSGHGVNDFYSPEINSIVVPLPGVAGCESIPDSGADLSAWTNSFANIRCYDTIKVNALLNEINGKTHDGSSSAPVPNVFGMNFQAVSVGQKLVENGVAGGYLDSTGTPSANLLQEIQFVDSSIGKFVNQLKQNGLYESTMIVITAKHGQSPIDPKKVLRIPADDHSLKSPADLLGDSVAQASEDDVSLIWLKDQSQTASAVATLEDNQALIGSGEIFSGRSLELLFNNPAVDPRTPDIIVQSNVGVIYTGGKKKIAEHGGFSHDDLNVMLLVSNVRFAPATITIPVQTTQVAPTILQALGINPVRLQAVQQEKTQVLPGISFPAPF
ncbi:MAG: alkaline phosphatase family protein [Acidobacteriaceae bacterium]|nr:alkaline phosphatase family protein [Acidobacteriaceae bacterium]